MLNSASALHRTLEKLAGQSGPIVEAWSTALQATWGSTLFARRHSEVIALWRDTMMEIQLLSNPQARERNERYLWEWWNIVVAPKDAWNTEQIQEKINPQTLDLLAGLGDTLSELAAGQTEVLGNERLEELKNAFTEWQEWLTSGETNLPGPLIRSLLADIEHSLWLISEAAFYGAARVRNQSEATIGRVVVATPQVPAQGRDVWNQHARKLVCRVAAVLTVVTVGSAAITTAGGSVASSIESVDGVVESVEHLISDVIDQPIKADHEDTASGQ